MNNINKRNIIFKILLIIYLILILFFSLKSLESDIDSTNSSNEISSYLATMFRVSNNDNFKNLIRKLVGHFSFFIIFSLISTFMYLFINKSLKYRIIFNYISVIIFIIFSEFILEAIAINRNPSIKDALIDLLGFLLGSISIYIYFFIYRYIIDKELYLNNRLHLIYTIVLGTIYILSIIVFIILANQGIKETQKVSKSISEPIVDISNQVTGNKREVTNNINTFIRKLIGHFSYFIFIGFISFLFYLSINKIKKYYLLLIHLFIGISFSYITEFIIEKNVYGRSPLINDFYINLSGFILITLILIITYYLSKTVYILDKDGNKQ